MPSVSGRGTAFSSLSSFASCLRTGVRRGSLSSRRVSSARPSEVWATLISPGQPELGIGDAHVVLRFGQQPGCTYLVACADETLDRFLDGVDPGRQRAERFGFLADPVGEPVDVLIQPASPGAEFLDACAECGKL